MECMGGGGVRQSVVAYLLDPGTMKYSELELYLFTNFSLAWVNPLTFCLL